MSTRIPAQRAVPAARPAVPVVDALRELTDRDLSILDTLAEHKVLTTGQLADLAFPNLDTAQHRLALLHRRGVLARFRSCQRPGSQPWRYSLGLVGAALVAAQRGTPPPRPATHAERIARLARHPALPHLLGTNGFFCTLAKTARTTPDAALERWWSERRATQACGGLAHPDGHGIWTEHGTRCAFFLEYDTGTEALDRLPAKLSGYRDAAAAGGPAYPVLFWLPSSHRETHLRQAFEATPPPVPVATAAADLADARGLTPADAVWLPADPLTVGHQRVRLADLTRATPPVVPRPKHLSSVPPDLAERL